MPAPHPGLCPQHPLPANKATDTVSPETRDQGSGRFLWGILNAAASRVLWARGRDRRRRRLATAAGVFARRDQAGHEALKPSHLPHLSPKLGLETGLKLDHRDNLASPLMGPRPPLFPSTLLNATMARRPWPAARCRPHGGIARPALRLIPRPPSPCRVC